jgi:hypothetical protein
VNFLAKYITIPLLYYQVSGFPNEIRTAKRMDSVTVSLIDSIVHLGIEIAVTDDKTLQLVVLSICCWLGKAMVFLENYTIH